MFRPKVSIFVKVWVSAMVPFTPYPAPYYSLFWGWGALGKGSRVGDEGLGVKSITAETTQTVTKMLTLGLNTML